MLTKSLKYSEHETHFERDWFSSIPIMISFGTTNHSHSNWYYRARLKHSLLRGWGKCSSPTQHLGFNTENTGKMVTEYVLPCPLLPSIIRKRITNLFPEASTYANVYHEIFIWKSHQHHTDNPWSKTPCKVTQYKESEHVYVGGESIKDKIRLFLEM